VECDLPDRRQVVLLVLTRTQQQPIKLDGGRDAARLRDGGREWPLPDIVGCRFEPLEQLEPRFAEPLHYALRGLDGPCGVPRRLGLLIVEHRQGGRLGGRFTQSLANRGKDLIALV
jgi:hypothetical protein